MFDPLSVQKDFALLSAQVHGKKLVYLDSAATSQKPQVVIDAIAQYYHTSNANVHRGVHALSDASTLAWEKARQTIAEFFGAKDTELIITRNTTEALNLVALGWARHQLRPGDVILTSLLEHHANLVPWQEVAKATGARIEFVPLTVDGRIELDQVAKALHSRVKLLALTHVSNALGTLVDIAAIGQLCRDRHIRFAVDGAQGAAHLPVSFDQLPVDFYACSAHKMLGPMGMGALLVRQVVLDSNEMQPVLFGGGMISAVYPDHAEFHEDPRERFTAGTPDVASAVGWAAAIEYLSSTVSGMHSAAAHDSQLVAYAYEKLSQIPRVQIVGPAPLSTQQKIQRVGSVSFIYQGVHAHDVAQVLDSEGVAVRSGHHCTMPLHTHFGWQATVRASFQVYTSESDIDALVAALAKVEKVFGVV